jgi:hypothetical protein
MQCRPPAPAAEPRDACRSGWRAAFSSLTKVYSSGLLLPYRATMTETTHPSGGMTAALRIALAFCRDALAHRSGL